MLKDAYRVFEDLCALTAGEVSLLLHLEDINRSFGLELIESVLSNHHDIFCKVGRCSFATFRTIADSAKIPEFTTLVREKVCPLVLFMADKSSFPYTMRLMRVVLTLVRRYLTVLTMECEIFLTILLKVHDPENPLWHRTLSLEILRAITSNPTLLR